MYFVSPSYITYHVHILIYNEQFDYFELLYFYKLYIINRLMINEKSIMIAFCILYIFIFLFIYSKKL